MADESPPVVSVAAVTAIPRKSLDSGVDLPEGASGSALGDEPLASFEGSPVQPPSGYCGHGCLFIEVRCSSE